MNDNIIYWLSVYPPFNVGSSGIRYYLWKNCFPHDNKQIFKCKTKFELKIFMDLNGMKIEKVIRISRDSSHHKNKIVYASFIVNSVAN